MTLERKIKKRGIQRFLHEQTTKITAGGC